MLFILGEFTFRLGESWGDGCIGFIAGVVSLVCVGAIINQIGKRKK